MYKHTLTFVSVFIALLCLVVTAVVHVSSCVIYCFSALCVCLCVFVCVCGVAPAGLDTEEWQQLCSGVKLRKCLLPASSSCLCVPLTSTHTSSQQDS